MALEGNLAITDGRLKTYIDLLGMFRGSAKPETPGGLRLFSLRPPLRDMVFNVRITSKKPFEIRSNVVRSALRPDVMLEGTGQLPILTGKVYIDPSRVKLPAGNMKIESGLIRFAEEAPDRPELDFTGVAQMRGYDITAAVQGPYNEPTVTLNSIPPISNEDILLLLLTGKAPVEAESDRASDLSRNLNVAIFIGRDMIDRWFDDSEESGESVLERFEVEVGRHMTRNGDETIDAQFCLVEDCSREGAAFYITGQKDVFDYYNAGVKAVFRFR
jgi:translocation and assembly module TamB